MTPDERKKSYVVATKYRGTTLYLVVYSELVQAARYGGLTTYQAIAQLMGLATTGNFMGSQTGRILGEISEDELRLGRPLLSALAVGVSGVPGDGFFGLAEGLGKLPPSASKDERLRLWEEERDAVYKVWKPKY